MTSAQFSTISADLKSIAVLLCILVVVTACNLLVSTFRK